MIVQRVWKKGVALALAAALIWCGLAIAAAFLGNRPQLPIILAINGALSILLSRLSALSGGLPLPALDVGSQLILLSWLALYIQLIARLLATNHFNGNTVDFELGVMCSEGLCDSNPAFTLEFASFGHCTQGCLAILLFPAVQREVALFGSARGAPASQILFATEFLCLGVIVYPIYNVIKRFLLYGDEFATSSFSNNAAEWGSGVLFGIMVGLCFEAWESGQQASAEQSSDKYVTPYSDVLMKVRLIGGSINILMSLLAGILYGLSWGNTFGHDGAYSS